MGGLFSRATEALRGTAATPQTHNTPAVYPTQEASVGAAYPAPPAYGASGSQTRTATRGASPGMDDYLDDLYASVTDEGAPSAAPAAGLPASVAARPPVERGQTDLELFNTVLTNDFSFKGQTFLAKVVEVYDGDTVRCAFRPASGARIQQYKVRLNGYDSPEMRPTKVKEEDDDYTRSLFRFARETGGVKCVAELVAALEADRQDEIQAAHVARDALVRMLDDFMVYIDCGPSDKYGRILATMYTRAGPERGENLNQWMMANGFGAAYDGGTKAPNAFTQHVDAFLAKHATTRAAMMPAPKPKKPAPATKTAKPTGGPRLAVSKRGGEPNT